MNNIFMVNKNKKAAFLKSVKEQYETATYELYNKLMIKLDEFENYKGISAISMAKNDFLELLTSLNSSSLSVLYTYRSAINNYLVFITDTTKFKMGLLELKKITKRDLESCLNTITENTQFITEEEYYEIITNDEGNYQDKLIVILLWNKIKGERQYSEILDLKRSDVDIENRTITLPDRVVKLTKKEIDIVQKAMYENFYTKVSVDKDRNILKSQTNYVYNGYLVKSTLGARNINMDNDKCPYSTLANRLSRYFNIVLKRSELTGLKIYKSSIYFYMILEYGRKLTTTELTDYLEKNNLRLSLSSSYREQDIMYDKLVEQGLI